MDASGNEEQPTMDPSENEEQPSSGFEKGSILRDPVPSKTKGREKSNKKNEPSRRTVTCGCCKGGGHNIQTCPVRKEHKKVEARLGSDDPPSVATPTKRRGGDGRGEARRGQGGH
ncbi:hypothetical protein ACLB2K_049337 [Fragaria x ananassa]